MPAPANEAVAAAPQADTLSSVPRLTSVDSRMAPVTTFWYACRAGRARALVGGVTQRALTPGSEHGVSGNQQSNHMRRLLGCLARGEARGAMCRLSNFPCPSNHT
jgi:hypothetical protein